MENVLDFLLLLLHQFSGAPGLVENNLIQFGLAVIFWAVLFNTAWSHQRYNNLSREKLLIWGFDQALVRKSKTLAPHQGMQLSFTSAKT